MLKIKPLSFTRPQCRLKNVTSPYPVSSRITKQGWPLSPEKNSIENNLWTSGWRCSSKPWFNYPYEFNILVRQFYYMTYKPVNGHQNEEQKQHWALFWEVCRSKFALNWTENSLSLNGKRDFELNIPFQLHPSVFVNKGYYNVNIQVCCQVKQIKRFQQGSSQYKLQNCAYHFIVAQQIHTKM